MLQIALWLLIKTYAMDSKNIVLTPNNTNATGDLIGLIYISGANMEAAQYIPLCQSIQNLFPQPLYIGIPSFIDNLPLIPEIVHILPQILSEMEQAGLPKNSNIFMAGHSLGGDKLAEFTAIYQYNYTSIYPSWKYKGQLLNAAYIPRQFRDNDTKLLLNYSIPTFTISGELDGMCRPSRIFEQFYIQLVKNKSDSNSSFVNNQTLLQYPVILVNGMNHMQFSSGNIPPSILNADLIPEIEYATAHNIAAQHMSCWMSLQLNSSTTSNSCDFHKLYNAVADTNTFANPFIAAFILEGSYWLESPCDCDALICSSTDYCQGGAPYMDNNIYHVNEWVPQIIMCGFHLTNQSIKVQQINTDSFHPVGQVHPIHYANIWNNCSVTNQSYYCTLNTSTVTQNSYNDTSVYGDVGQVSALEMKHKMKSRKACYEHIDGGFVEEDFEICGKINQHSIDWALQNAPKQTLKRWDEYGELLIIGSDMESETGSNWTDSTLNETRLCNETMHRYFTSVQSNYLYLETVQNGCKFIPTECGVHYCKVLSPARVMEWLYTDGLRFNLSLYNQNKTVNTTC